MEEEAAAARWSEDVEALLLGVSPLPPLLLLLLALLPRGERSRGNGPLANMAAEGLGLGLFVASPAVAAAAVAVPPPSGVSGTLPRELAPDDEARLG